MKYYEFGSLKQLLRSTKVTRILATKYLLDISNGLRTLHEESILHCDLKPDNVLVDKDEKGLFMVLTDFGISQILSDKFIASKMFQVANVRGLSVHYAAPEIFRIF